MILMETFLQPSVHQMDRSNALQTSRLHLQAHARIEHYVSRGHRKATTTHKSIGN